jgi:hypothetical protein
MITKLGSEIIAGLKYLIWFTKFQCLFQRHYLNRFYKKIFFTPHLYMTQQLTFIGSTCYFKSIGLNSAKYMTTKFNILTISKTIKQRHF